MSYTIKQISIFAENKPGKLATIAEALEQEGVNIRAFSIAEATGFGVVRAIVDKPDEAHRKLGELGFVNNFTEVIGVKMKDRPGGLKDIAKIMGDAGINIEYSYAYSGQNAAILILRVDHVKDAIQALQSHDCQLVDEAELI
jgi:hypothetical protein